MVRLSPASAAALAVVLALRPSPALAQSRADENAVTQAEDAFGFSVGRESLGIYDADNARGFSPSAAGNLAHRRSLLRAGRGDPRTSSSNSEFDQGRPVGPGISLSPPRAGSSISASAAPPTSSAPRSSSMATATAPSAAKWRLRCHWHRAFHSASVSMVAARISRTAPATGITPKRSSGAGGPRAGSRSCRSRTAFTDVDDNSSPVYVPAGNFLPPQPLAGHFSGPWWNGINRTHLNSGVLSSADTVEDLAAARSALFRSIRHLRNGYTYLVDELQPDGIGHRIHVRQPAVEQQRGQRRGAVDACDRRRTAAAHAAFQPARPPGPARVRRGRRDRPRNLVDLRGHRHAAAEIRVRRAIARSASAMDLRGRL